MIIKKLLFVISFVVFVFSCSFTSFAIVGLDKVRLSNFEDGPWTTMRCGFVMSNDDGSFVQSSVPNWRSGTGAGTNYYQFTKGYQYEYSDVYMFADHYNYNIAIVAEDPLLELYLFDHDYILLQSVLEDAFLGEKDGKYYYGVSMIGICGLGFRGSSNMIWATEYSPAFYGGSEYENIQSLLPYMSGIYDGNSLTVKYPGMSWYGYVDNPLSRTASYGSVDALFPLVVDQIWTDGAMVSFKLNDCGGFLREGSKYDFNFKVLNGESARISFAGSDNYSEYDILNNNLQFSVSGDGRSVSDLVCGVIYNNNYSDRICHAVAVKYVSSMSDDIGTLPPDDSGDGEGSGTPNYSSALAQIGKSLESVMAAVSDGSQQIVNNITYQTTQITNTITNTVTNMTQQITQGLQSVQQGITDKLGVVQDGITNKLQNVQDGINNKLESVQEEIVNGYDNSAMESEKSELSGSVEELEQAEKEVMDNVTGYLEDFEYPSFDSISGGVLASIAFIGTFLQSLFLAIGDFGLIITFSLTMIFVLIIVGYHRIRT